MAKEVIERIYDCYDKSGFHNEECCNEAYVSHLLFLIAITITPAR